MKKRTIFLALILGCFGVLFVGSANLAMAAIGGSGGHGSYNPYCTNYCTSWGAGWHWQDIDTFMSWPWDDGTNTGAEPAIKQQIYDTCKDVGGVYRLSFEYYNQHSDGSITLVPGQFAGLVSPDWGVPYEDRAGVPEGTVKEAFLKAKYIYQVADTDWDETAWFCYSDELEEKPDPEPEPGSGDANFYSTSTATVSGLSDGPNMSVTTDPDGSSEIKFSTDDASVNINFSHTISYVNNSSYASRDTFPNVSTSWNIKTDSGNGYATSGSYSTNAKSSASSNVNSNTVTVALAPGEKKTVCQYIQYNPKYYSFGRNDIGWWVYPTVEEPEEGEGPVAPDPPYWHHDYYEYYTESQSGSGVSKVCVEITRPENPGGTGATSTGLMNSTLMYAGESADSIGWNLNGHTYPTRRISEWQAIVYQAPSNQAYYDGITDGSSRYYGSGACAYYNGKSNNSYCDIFSSARDASGKSPGSTGFNENDNRTHSVKSQHNVVVPDQVGDKYCNSFAYRYEYWYYVTGQGWQHYPSSDYWYVYPAACRTIAKKPSTSIWNNSLLTSGGVRTTLSPRYNTAVMGTVSSGSSNVTTYGSWAEYLDVIGGKVNGLTSGASLALGSSKSGGVYSLSPLTIANSTTNLGYSGISSSTTLRTRLETYLKDDASEIGETIGGAGWENITDTRILRRTGDLRITGNITLNANSPYSDIYSLPQVVLFVDGNVEISSEVERIDAWIIATGTVDTCSEFVVGGSSNRGTEADTIYQASSYCAKQLVINGPVITNSLELNRSFGSDPLVGRRGTFGANSRRETPAEVFNYRADNYLWSYAQAGRYHSSYTESYTRELAPRY